MFEGVMLEDGRLVVPMPVPLEEGGFGDSVAVIGPDDELYKEWLPFIDAAKKYTVDEIREAFGDIPGL